MAFPKTTGEFITADHEVLSEDSESRLQHRYAVVVQDFLLLLDPKLPTSNESACDTKNTLQQFMPPSEHPVRTSTDNSLEFTRACEDPNWNQNTATLYRYENQRDKIKSQRRNSISSGAIYPLRRLVERHNGILLLLAKYSKFFLPADENRMRNVTTRSCWSEQKFLTNQCLQKAKRLHQLGNKMFPGPFIGYALHAEGTWSGDFLIAGWRDLEKSHRTRSPRRKIQVQRSTSHHSSGNTCVPMCWRSTQTRRIRRTSTSSPSTTSKEDGAGGESDAQIQPPPQLAGGDSNANV